MTRRHQLAQDERMGMWRRVGAIVLAMTCSCSLVATTPLASGYEPVQGQEPDCSQSNWAAGADMMLMAGTAIASIATAADASSMPANASSYDRSSEVQGSVALGGVALLTGYSMVRGFQRSSECRDATRAAGLEAHGDDDWLKVWAVALTIGGAALAGGAQSSYDPDLCQPGAIRTALCWDGVYSCSMNRSGTCSHHRGVQEWF